MEQSRTPPGSIFRHRLGRTANRMTRGRLQRALARRAPLLVHRTLHCPTWPRSLDGFTIGHLSDFHIGELLGVEQSLAIVDRLREHEGEIDLVAVTGDIIDFYPHGVEPLLEALAEFPAPLGVWNVLGNHDKIVDTYGYLRLCEEAELRTLINDSVEIDHRGVPVTITGVDWARKQPELDVIVRQALRGAPERPGGHILLAHNPLAFDMAAEMGVHVTLSGHTHGGQLNLLHPTPQRRAVGLSSVHRYAWGVYEKDDRVLHVTSGAGSWFPFRVRCPSEIAILTVRSGERPPHAGLH